MGWGTDPVVKPQAAGGWGKDPVVRPATAAEPSMMETLASYLPPGLTGGRPDLAGAANRTVANSIEGLSVNTAHRWAPHILAAVDEGREMFNATSPASYGDRVARHRKQFIGQLDPAMTAAGGMPMMMAAGAARPALNTLAGIASTATLGAAGDADRRGLKLMSPKGAADVGVNAAISTAIPYGIKGVGWLGGKIYDHAIEPAGRTLREMAKGGFVKPTPEAQRLMAEGADLSLGRMDPNSAMGRMEELATAKVSGGSIDEMRKATDRGVRGLLIRKAGAPGATAPDAALTTGEQVKQVKQGFTEAYDAALDGVMVNPDKYLGKGGWRGVLTDESVKGAARRKGAFELAAEDTNIDATKGDRNRALKWLRDQATMLMPRKSGANAGMVEARNLHSLRTSLGKEIAALEDATGSGDRARKLIYEKARSFVDEVLHEGLPPDASERLRAVDAAYPNKVALSEAAKKAFKSGTEIGGGEFTAEQLLAAIGKNGGRGGAYEQMSRDAHNVLTAKYRPTGIQGQALDFFPGSKYFAQPMAQFANSSEGFKAHALGLKPAPAWAKNAVGAADAVGTFGSWLHGASTAPAAMSSPTRSLLDLLRDPVTVTP